MMQSDWASHKAALAAFTVSFLSIRRVTAFRRIHRPQSEALYLAASCNCAKMSGLNEHSKMLELILLYVRVGSLAKSVT